MEAYICVIEMAKVGGRERGKEQRSSMDAACVCSSANDGKKEEAREREREKIGMECIKEKQHLSCRRCKEQVIAFMRFPTPSFLPLLLLLLLE